MTFRSPNIYWPIIITTLFFSVIGYIAPPGINTFSAIILLVLVIVIGIPHGATDLVVFQHLNQTTQKIKSSITFLGLYLLIVIAFTVLWVTMPLTTLILFFVLSCYHFGQSNLYYLDFPNKTSEYVAYLLWGSCVLITPILLNPDTTQVILEHILRAEPTWFIKIRPYSVMISATLIGLNLLLLFFLYLKHLISNRFLGLEIINIFILGMLFWTTPLLLSFAVYFGLWHSLNSMLEQVKHLSENKKSYSLKQYYWSALPISLISFMGIILIILALNAYQDINSAASLFFILIGSVTLPHVLLIDKLYADKPIERFERYY